MPFNNKLVVELSSENNINKSYFYETLELPATDGEIHDTMQKLRLFGQGSFWDMSIINCPKLPELADTRLEYYSIGELNIFAKRLESLTDDEVIKLNGLFNHLKNNLAFKDGVSLEALINYTYGLDTISLYKNVGNTKQLGQLVIKDELNYEITEYLSENLYPLLDSNKLGEMQMVKDDGIFVGNCYVALADYSYPIEYERNEYVDNKYYNPNAIFRLEVAEAPTSDEDNSRNTRWIELPTDITKIENMKNLVFYGFESAIPQIDRFMFADMSNLPLLNDIANDYAKMSDNDRIKFKAILSAEKIDNIIDASLVADIMDKYELSSTPYEENTFFKEYLLKNLPDNTDNRWLNDVHCEKTEKELIDRLGARITDYGVISAYGKSLYAIVPYEQQQSEVAPHREPEKYEVVEVAGQQALFTNSRIKDSEVPSGLHKYDLRDDGSGDICTLERAVFVNHAGTVLTKHPILLSDSGYITLSNDDSINFLGDEMTADEFVSSSQPIDSEQIDMGGLHQ